MLKFYQQPTCFLIFLFALLLLSQDPIKAMQGPPALSEGSVIKGEHASYVVGKELGRGNFGSIARAVRQSDGMIVAVKLIEVVKGGGKNDIESEVYCLRSCGHFSVVGYLDHAWLSDNQCIIVMELAQGLNARSSIVKNTDYKFEEYEFALFAIQLVLALHHVHSKKIVHRDLKPGNIIFDTTTKLLKLCDFGFAIQAEGQRLCRRVGSPNFFSPEIAKEKDYSFSTDVWSLGVTLFDVVRKEHLFTGNNLQDLCENIDQGRYASSYLDETPQEIQEFINYLLVYDQAQRPTIQQVLQHPYMKKCLCFFVLYWSMVIDLNIFYRVLVLKQIAYQVQLVQPHVPIPEEASKFIVPLVHYIVTYCGYKKEVTMLCQKIVYEPKNVFNDLALFA